MNSTKISVIASSLLSVFFATHPTCNELSPCIAPYYSVRSQGAYESRHWAGLYDILSNTERCRPYGIFTINTDYSRSFNAQQIAHNLLGAAGSSGITIAGSRVANRGPRDLLADYFYLPDDFKSTISCAPIIDTFLVDFSYIINLNQWAHGTYFTLHAPIVHTRFDFRMQETVLNRGVNPQPAGILTPAELNRGQLLEDFTSYSQGNLVQPATQTVTNQQYLTIFQQLKNAQISPIRKKETGIADIRMAFGWNWTQEDYHVGINLQAAAPGGNRPEGIFLLEPIVGNGHHWELGSNINGHYDLWKNWDETQKVSLYAQINLTHLFNAEQFRTFDLKNSPLSRYMLAQKLDTPITNNLQGGPENTSIPPTYQFKQEFAPVANLSTIRVNVSAALQADIIVNLHMQSNRYSFDLGYNFWGRSADNITVLGSNELDNNKSWALKGDAQVFGFAADNTISVDPLIIPPTQKVTFPLIVNQPVPLSATQSNATIYHGTNLPATGAPTQDAFEIGRENLTIDSPQPAWAGAQPVPINALPALALAPDNSLQVLAPPAVIQLNTVPNGNTQIQTSIQPKLLQLTDLNLCGGKTKGATSSIFAHFHYTGECDLQCLTPSIGIGGQAEFAHNDTKNRESNGINTALSQWHVWLKIGFAFK